jgi:hypothetical protein
MENGSEPKQSGQLLGCFFAAGLVIFIFLVLFLFMRACA